MNCDCSALAVMCTLFWSKTHLQFLGHLFVHLFSQSVVTERATAVSQLVLLAVQRFAHRIWFFCKVVISLWLCSCVKSIFTRDLENWHTNKLGFSIPSELCTLCDQEFLRYSSAVAARDILFGEVWVNCLNGSMIISKLCCIHRSFSVYKVLFRTHRQPK